MLRLLESFVCIVHVLLSSVAGVPQYIVLMTCREFREWMIDQWKTYSVNCCDAIVEHGKEEFNSKLHVCYCNNQWLTRL